MRLVKKHLTNILEATIELPRSKSISNRVLIIQALSAEPISIAHLSTSEDTKVLHAALERPFADIINVGHAGTAMRFLTAFFAFQPDVQILEGSRRMHQRPIAPLVGSLQQLGANIKYLVKSGFPPLLIDAPEENEQLPKSIDLPGNISSQFISALMLIGPTLQGGLRININTHLVSSSYIKMTAACMQHAGVSIVETKKPLSIHIPEQKYQQAHFDIEPDWSAAAYFYGHVALSQSAFVVIKDLKPRSWQGDAFIVKLFEVFGVKTQFTSEGAVVTKINVVLPHVFEVDLLEMPDTIQTFAVVCAALGVELRASGWETLRIKETDRVAALAAELQKVNVYCGIEGNLLIVRGRANWIETPVFETYHDHRMAMSVSLLAAIGSIRIEDSQVVVKSYPDYWNDLQHLGFKSKELED